MKRFLKRHRYTCVLLLIFILLVVLGMKAKDMLVPDEGKPTYGDRLKDMKKHPLSDDDYKKIDDALKSNKSVIKVSHRLQGKTINYFITFDSKTSVKDAKSIGDSILKSFSDDILEYYSIQVSLLKEDETDRKSVV